MKNEALPKIMIALLAKNDAKYLPRFLKAMSELDYPKDKLKWIWMYGKSIDNTLEIILDFHKKQPYKYAIYEEPIFENKTRSSLWVADALNAFKPLREKEEYILLPDTDIVRIPKGTLRCLLNQKKDIIAPYIWIENKSPRQFFDTYIFRKDNQTFRSIVLDGKHYDAWNPPFQGLQTPVQMDSVGSFILMRGEVFEKIAWANPAPHFQFCKKARKASYTVWALPSLEIEHANVENEEVPHFPLEWYVDKGLLPKEILKEMLNN